MDAALTTGFGVSASSRAPATIRPMHTAHSDPLEDLLVAVARGDEAAFARLYDAVSARVFGLVLRIVADQTLAEEVTQETFLDVWRRAGTFEASKGSGLSWIFTIAHRRSVDRVRSVVAARKRDTAYGVQHQDRDFDSTVDEVTGRMEAERVRGAMGRMSPVQREAVELAYFGGLSHAQVAAELGIALGTAKSRIRDGLLCLRGVLGGEA